jgi:hypothetical protein
MIGLFSMPRTTRLLKPSDLLPRQKEARNITADVNNRIFIKIPTGGRVRHRVICFVGMQDSGKSVTSNFIVSEALEFYGTENVNIVHTDDPRVFIEQINERPVQIGVIGDATAKASSREIHKQTAFLKDYNRSRHIFEDKYPGKPGIMMYLFDWQRWKELDPALRAGHVLFFKTGMTDKQDRNDILDKLGEDYFDVLNRIWDEMDRGNDDIKSLSVVRIASKAPEDGGVGIYISKMVPWVLPPIIRSDIYFKTDTATTGDILEKYRSQAKWEVRIEAYELVENEAYTQAEAALMLSEKYNRSISQGYVSNAIAKVKELVEK